MKNAMLKRKYPSWLEWVIMIIKKIQLVAIAIVFMPFSSFSADYCDDGGVHSPWCGADIFREIRKIKDMEFPPVIGGYSQRSVLHPGDLGAAVFEVKGFTLMAVRVFVKPNTGYMYSVNNNSVYISEFTYGGSVDSRGVGKTNNYGILSNIRVGGVVSVAPQNREIKYSNTFNIEVGYD